MHWYFFFFYSNTVVSKESSLYDKILKQVRLMQEYSRKLCNPIHLTISFKVEKHVYKQKKMCFGVIAECVDISLNLAKLFFEWYTETQRTRFSVCNISHEISKKGKYVKLLVSRLISFYFTPPLFLLTYQSFTLAFPFSFCVSSPVFLPRFVCVSVSPSLFFSIGTHVFIFVTFFQLFFSLSFTHTTCLYHAIYR